MMTFEDLKVLADVHGPCLTMIQPLRDTAQVDADLAAAAQQASALIATRGFDQTDCENFLRPVLKLAQNTSWAGCNGSLLIFRAPGFTRASFWPDTLPAETHLADEFFILPLLRGLSVPHGFWVLGLSTHGVRLYRACAEGICEVELPAELSLGFAAAPGFDPLRDFFHRIDRALRPILEEGGDPLVLVSMPRELAIYRAGNTYPHLMAEVVPGDPDALGCDQIFAAAQEIVARAPGRIAHESMREMDAAIGRDLLLTDRAAIRHAAQTGQIEHLFIDANFRESEDVVNPVALAVIRNSGTVISSTLFHLPVGMAAILRYQIPEVPKPEPAFSTA